MYRQRDGDTQTQIDIHTDTWTDRHKHRQIYTDAHKCRQTYTQTDRDADRQGHIQTDMKPSTNLTLLQ